MEVIINGEKYLPIKEYTNYKIGIAITTYNRHELLYKVLEYHKKYQPSDSVIVVVDDGSDKPVSVPDGVVLIRHSKSKGVVGAKNTCLKVLIEYGCTELFLWDDDAWPLKDNWHKPYVDSPEPHLAYQFLDFSTTRKMKDITIIYSDNKHIAYSGQRGLMLYYNKSVIDKVGGFDWIYNKGMYEHSDLALRIYNNNLTSWMFADVKDSNKLIYSLDEHEATRSSIDSSIRISMLEKNRDIFNYRKNIKYKEYSSLIEPENIIITSYLTENIDPQRNIKLPLDHSLLNTWANSIKEGKAIILSDNLNSSPKDTILVKVESSKDNPYLIRWVHIYRYLINNKNIKYIWATDGTDVEMLKSPFKDMESDKIYIGSEVSTLDNPWMIKNHSPSYLKEFFINNKTLPLLNCGIIGGSRNIIINFLKDVIDEFYDLKTKRFFNLVEKESGIEDMGLFNYIAYSKYKNKIITGPQVHTIFKSNGIGKEFAWWKHK